MENGSYAVTYTGYRLCSRFAPRGFGPSQPLGQRGHTLRYNHEWTSTLQQQIPDMNNALGLPAPPPGFQIGYATPRARSRSNSRTPAPAANHGATMTMQSDLDSTNVGTDRIPSETPTRPNYATQDEPSPTLITKRTSTMTKILSRGTGPSSPRQTAEVPTKEETKPWISAAKSSGTPMKPDWK